MVYAVEIGFMSIARFSHGGGILKVRAFCVRSTSVLKLRRRFIILYVVHGGTRTMSRALASRLNAKGVFNAFRVGSLAMVLRVVGFTAPI